MNRDHSQQERHGPAAPDLLTQYVPSNNGDAADRPNRHPNCFRNLAAGSVGR
jgi:hypothetical protein